MTFFDIVRPFMRRMNYVCCKRKSRAFRRGREPGKQFTKGGSYVQLVLKNLLNLHVSNARIIQKQKWSR
jgi:hypothetical protein